MKIKQLFNTEYKILIIFNNKKSHGMKKMVHNFLVTTIIINCVKNMLLSLLKY